MASGDPPQCLRIGDVFLLRLEDNYGFVTANPGLTPQVRAEQLKEGVHYPPELAACRFQVVPKQQYTERNAYAAFVARHGLAEQAREEREEGTYRVGRRSKPKGGAAATPKSSKFMRRWPSLGQVAGAAGKEDMLHVRERMLMMHEACAQEQAANHKEFLAAVGDPVLYGQVVQLLHVASGRFLSVRKTTAAVTKGTLRITLEEEGDVECGLEIHSGYNTKAKGMKVLVAEVVTFVSTEFLGMGLHASSEAIEAAESAPELDQHEYVARRAEVDASRDHSELKLVPFSSHPSVSPSLGTSLSGYSIVTIRAVRGQSECYNFLCADDLHGCYFEMMSNHPAVRMRQCKNLWQLEPQTLEYAGMPFGFDHRVRIRHLVTGKYLTGWTLEAGEEPLPDELLRLSHDFLDANCLWRLVAFNQEQQGGHLIGKVAFAFLRHESSNWLSSGSALYSDAVHFVGEDLMSSDHEGNLTVDAHVVIGSKHAASMIPGKADGNALMVQQISESVVSKVRKVCSARMVLNRFVSKLMVDPLLACGDFCADEGEEADKDVDASPALLRLASVFKDNFMQVKETLRDLHHSLDPDKWMDSAEPDTPSVYQGLMFNVGLIDSICSVLSLVHIQDFMEMSDALQSVVGQAVMQCGTLCHKTLQMMLRNNKRVQMYVFNQHLDLITSHLMGPPGLTAADTLAFVLKENIDLVQQMTEPHLNSFVQLIHTHGRLPRFMNLLCQMCGTVERPVPRSQHMLLKLIMGSVSHLHRDAATSIFMPADSRNGSWIIRVKDLNDRLKPGALLDCQLFSACLEDKTKASIWEWNLSPSLMQEEPRLCLFIFYVMSLHLVCAMCYGRNTLTRDAFLRASKAFGLNFEFPALLEGVNNNKLPLVLRSSLLQVLFALWVDVEPYHPPNLKKLTRMLPRRSRSTYSAQSHATGRSEARSAASVYEAEVRINRVLGSVLKLLDDVRDASTESTAQATMAKFVKSAGKSRSGRHSLEGSLPRGITPRESASRKKTLQSATKIISDRPKPANRSGDTPGRVVNTSMPARKLERPSEASSGDSEERADSGTRRTYRVSFRPSENLFYPPGQLEANGEGEGEGEGERTSGTVPKEEHHRISQVVRARRPSLAVPTGAQKQRERRASRTSVCLAQALGQEVVQQVLSDDVASKFSFEGRRQSLTDVIQLDRYWTEPLSNRATGSKTALALDKRMLTVGGSALRKEIVQILLKMYKLGLVELQSADSHAALHKMLELLMTFEKSDDMVQFKKGYRDKVVTDTLLTVLLIFEFALNTHNEEKCSSVFREFCAQSKDSTKAAEQCLETLKCGLQDCGLQDHVAVKSPSTSLKSLNTCDNNNNNSSRRFWRFSGDSNTVRPYKAPDEENRQATMMAALQSTSFLQKQLAYVLSGVEEQALSHVSLFQLDPLGQGFSLAEINNRTTSNILGLVRHEDPSLVSMTFVLLDNLLTKRKRLITSLVQTYIIDDPNLMIIFDRAKVLVAQAISNYGYVASLDDDERIHHCQAAVAVFQELSTFLVPDVVVHIHDPDGDASDDSDADPGHGSLVDSVFLTKQLVARCQMLMHDLNAHDVALRFLKLPMRRLPAGKAGDPPKAEDEHRHLIFSCCLKFIRHMLVVGEMNQRSRVNAVNQNIMLPHMNLLCSLADINPHAAETVVALLLNNVAAVAQKGNLVLNTFMRLLLRYGNQRQSCWVDVLRSVMVVNGPIKVYQNLVLRFVNQHEDAVLYLVSSSEERAKFAELMKPDPDLPDEPQFHPFAAYHLACVRLLVAGCEGQEAAFAVQIKGYISLKHALDMLLMPLDASVPQEVRRWVHRAYWELLQHAYFESDADHSLEQVLTYGNCIWHEDGEDGAVQRPVSIGGYPSTKPNTAPVVKTSDVPARESLMAVVLSEVERALQESPQDLVNSSSALCFLSEAVFPALQAYFHSHYTVHLTQMVEAHEQVLEELCYGLFDYLQCVREMQSPYTVACVNSVSLLLEQIHLVSSDAVREVVEMVDFHAFDSTAELNNQRRQAYSRRPSLNTGVQIEWHKLVQKLAAGLDVDLDSKTNDVIEYLRVDQTCRLKFGPVFVFARLLAQPYMTTVVGCKPPLPFEDVTAAICRLGASDAQPMFALSVRSKVRMIRAVRSALMIDDGEASVEAWKLGWSELQWTETHDGQPQSIAPKWYQASPKIKYWRQGKFNRLGATHMAAKMMASQNIFVVFEATELMRVLLEGGHIEVQTTLHSLLDTGEAWTFELLSNCSNSLQRCGQSLNRRKGLMSSSGMDEFKLDDDLEFHDIGVKATLNDANDPVTFANKLIRCLQQMVEGHNHKMQQLLQHQPRAAQSVDILLAIVDLLNTLQNHLLDALSELDNSFIDLMVTLFDFLTEMVQGPCTTNQEMLGSPQAGLFTAINRILSSLEYNNVRKEVALLKHKVKRAMFWLLVNLLEGLAVPEIGIRMIDSLDFKAVDQHMTTAYRFLWFAQEQDEARSKQDGESDSPAGQYPNSLGVASAPARTMSRMHSDTAARFPSRLSSGKKMSLIFNSGQQHGNFDNITSSMQAEMSSELQLLCIFVLKLNTVCKGKRPAVLPWLQELFDSNSPDPTLMGNHLRVSDKLQNFLRTHVGYVEVMFNNMVEPVFFQVSEQCSRVVSSLVWREAAKDKLQKYVSPKSRNLPDVKARELLVGMEEMMKDIDTTYRQATGITSYLALMIRYKRPMKFLSFWLSLVVLLTLVFSHEDKTADEPLVEAPISHVEAFLLAVNICQCLCFVLLYATYCVDDFVKYIQYFKEKQTLKDTVKLRLTAVAATAKVPSHHGSPDAPRRHKKEDAHLAVGEVPPPPSHTHSQRQITVMFRNVTACAHLAFYWYFWYNSCLLVASVMSLVASPFWLCFLLTIYITDSEAGSTIIRAIGNVGHNIVNTFILGLLFIFIFGIITFSVFKREYFDEEFERSTAPPCSTLYQCIGAHLLAGIGQGDISKLFHENIWDDVPSHASDSMHLQARSMMIIAFFMIWHYVLLNVFIALIASAFEALRDEQITVHEDSSSRCLVCSCSSHDFESFTRNGFKHHIERHHNPLSYIFYLHYLYVTDNNEFTGCDSMVQSAIEQGVMPEERTSWLPVNRALSLRPLIEEDQKLSSQMQLLNTVIQRQEQLSKRMDTFMQEVQDALGQGGFGSGANELRTHGFTNAVHRISQSNRAHGLASAFAQQLNRSGEESTRISRLSVTRPGTIEENDDNISTTSRTNVRILR